MFKKGEKKIEGYWHSPQIEKYNKIVYPTPIPNVLTSSEAEEIFKLIKEKEKVAKEVRCRGMSSSRITGERLGSREYETDEWLWPCDFAPHYVLEHKVKPTDEFLKYIGYNK